MRRSLASRRKHPRSSLGDRICLYRGLTPAYTSASDDEDPRAYVVRRPASTITEEEIVAFVASKVSKRNRLTGGVAFVSSIPKLPVRTLYVPEKHSDQMKLTSEKKSGKILRRELRERANKQTLPAATKPRL